MYSAPPRSNWAILRPLCPACAPALWDCAPNALQQGNTGFAAVSAVVTDDTERGKMRYMTPPYGLRADGPLMTGGCVGAASGAGIRFSTAGALGAGDPRSVVGLRTMPPRNPPPCPPPRAKLGVDPTTQAAAKSIAKTRFMIAIPRSAPPD